MLKRLGAALAALFALVNIARAAGTVPGFSLTPQFDLTGAVMPGCKLYIIQAGTVSTPQNDYQDTGLSIPAPNPQTCDASGRLPQWFVADGNIKLRLTTASGTQVFVQDNLLVVGPSSGGGGGGTVDPTTILSTGDMKLAYGTGILSGFVRANGRTIGSATSGATERANSDCQALFQYLWGADANLAVSGGRGASAAADWAANKTIALPDWRGRAIAGLDDMGNTAAGRLTNSFGLNATVLGSAGSSSETRTLVAGNVPQITLNVSGSVSASFQNVPITSGSWNNVGTVNISGSSGNYGQATAAIGNMNNLTSSGSMTGTAGNASPTAILTEGPTALTTIYIKL